jgi:hypothetical protein
MGADIQRVSANQEFLAAIFSKKPADAFILAWTLPNRKSYWFQDLDAPSQQVVNWTDRDVYVGAGLSPRDFGPSQRCKAADIIGITALWADIDISGPLHKKANLPPDEEIAIRLLKTIEIPYSVLVHSGHGLQAWWLFEYPWMFMNNDDWKAAQDFSYRWSDTITARAHAAGYEVDSTPDLSRVMRMVGTLNNKDVGNPKTVTTLEIHPNRVYQQEDFLPYMVDPKLRTFARPDSGTTRSLRLSADASPPFDKWEALRNADKRVQDSWDRTRRDIHDQSASAYDLSLANYAVQAAWTDQEICNLLIASRRMHGDDLKLRESYYQMTVQKARNSIEQNKASDVLDEMVNTRKKTRIEHAPAPIDGESELSSHSAILQNLSVKLGFNITKILRLMSTEPQFQIEVDDILITLGPVDNLIIQSRFRSNIASATPHYIRKFKTGEWDGIAEALRGVAEDVDIGVDATERGMITSWLDRYLAERPLYDDVNAAAEDFYPYRRDGHTYIFGTDFREWLNLHHEDMTPKEVGKFLHGFSCTPETINVRLINGRKTTRGVWRLPSELVQETYSEPPMVEHPKKPKTMAKRTQEEFDMDHDRGTIAGGDVRNT